MINCSTSHEHSTLSDILLSTLCRQLSYYTLQHSTSKTCILEIRRPPSDTSLHRSRPQATIPLLLQSNLLPMLFHFYSSTIHSNITLSRPEHWRQEHWRLERSRPCQIPDPTLMLTSVYKREDEWHRHIFSTCKIWPTHFQDISYSHSSEYSPPSDINLLPTLFQIFPTTLSDEDIFLTYISIPPEQSATLYLPHYCSSAQDIRFEESHQVSRLYHQEEEDPKVIKNDKDADRRQVEISNQIS